MTKISAIIVDDESLSVDVIFEYLKPFTNIEVVGKFTKSKSALEQIKILKPDLLFLDIQMPKIDGFQLLNEVLATYNPFVVFVTAFDQYAIKAFETNALGYILKPIDEQKFNLAVAKVIAQFEQNHWQDLKQFLANYSVVKEYLSQILIKEPNRLFYIPTDEILCFEASGDYVNVVTSAKNHLINESLISLESKLNPNDFIRIHRSTIVNVHQIKEFQPYFNGEYNLILTNGNQVKLSRNYKENLNRIFKEL